MEVRCKFCGWTGDRSRDDPNIHCPDCGGRLVIKVGEKVQPREGFGMAEGQGPPGLGRAKGTES